MEKSSIPDGDIKIIIDFLRAKFYSTGQEDEVKALFIIIIGIKNAIDYIMRYSFTTFQNNTSTDETHIPLKEAFKKIRDGSEKYFDARIKKLDFFIDYIKGIETQHMQSYSKELERIKGSWNEIEVDMIEFENRFGKKRIDPILLVEAKEFADDILKKVEQNIDPFNNLEKNILKHLQNFPNFLMEDCDLERKFTLKEIIDLFTTDPYEYKEKQK